MGNFEQLLEEMKRLNKNLQVTNVELSTVDETTLKEVVKETPIAKVETTKEEPEQPETETSQPEEPSYTKDEVLNLGKQFVQKADDDDKKAFKAKLEELGAGKLSNVTEDHYTEIVEFMNARLSA